MTPNRTICDVLQAMRQCSKTKNYSYLEGLIEEAQNLANRMEAALWDQKDFEYARKEHKDLKKEIKKLKEQKEKLEE
jgi:DNA helicase TIP49 (TBP-interacting protein)